MHLDAELGDPRRQANGLVGQSIRKASFNPAKLHQQREKRSGQQPNQGPDLRLHHVNTLTRHPLLRKRHPQRLKPLLDAGFLHRAELLLELVDLVAKSGRELELQLGGRGMHLILQLLDQQRQLGLGHPGQLGGMLAGGR
jgi:hypothetical protein